LPGNSNQISFNEANDHRIETSLVKVTLGAEIHWQCRPVEKHFYLSPETGKSGGLFTVQNPGRFQRHRPDSALLYWIVGNIVRSFAIGSFGA